MTNYYVLVKRKGAKRFNKAIPAKPKRKLLDIKREVSILPKSNVYKIVTGTQFQKLLGRKIKRISFVK